MWRVGNCKFYFRACIAIAACVLFMFCLGHFYTLGNMSPYIISYIYTCVGDKAIRHSVSIWLSAGSFACQGLGNPLAGALTIKIGYRPIIICSLICHVLGILLTGVTLKAGFGAVVFTYAIMVGCGIGGSYGLLLSLAASWFPKHRGLVVGICACGFGAGAIILTPIQTLIINPRNIAVNNMSQMFDDKEMLERVPRCLYIIGGIIAGLQLIGCIFVRPRPNEGTQIGSATEGSDMVSHEIKTSENRETRLRDFPPSEALGEVDIYLFWGIMCLSLIPVTLITATIKIVGQRSIPDDKYLSAVSTLGAVFSTLSRIAWGPVGDRFSFKMPLCCLNLFYGVVLITLPFITPIPGAGKYLYAVWVIFACVCIAGNFVLLPFAVSRAFGHKYFAVNYGLVFSACTPGSIIGALIVYFVKLENNLTEIYVASGIIACCCSIIALFSIDPRAPRFVRELSLHWNR